MFGRKSRGFVQTYEYGCRPEPITGLDAALHQMERRIWLWNRFVEIEHGIRTKVRELSSDESEQRAIDALQVQISDLRASIRERRRVEGERSSLLAELKNQVRTCRGNLAELMTTVKANRRERLVLQKSKLSAFERERSEKVKQAQRESGLYWCNYDDVRHAYEIARVRAMRAGTELREQRWNGSGRVAVRFQTGISLRTAFGGSDGRLQIDPVLEEARTSVVRGERRRLARTKVRIRVASAPNDRSPVWFEIPIVMHRSMPAEGLIRTASMIRESVGVSWRYRLILAVSCPHPPSPAPANRPRAALDLGWRIVPDGLRVVSWADSLGAWGTLVIPRADLAQFKKVDELWAIWNKRFVRARTSVLEFRRQNQIPAELQQCFDRVAERQSPEELFALVNIWQEHGFGGKESVLQALIEWRQKHIHLWTWAVNLRDQLARKRLDLYRCFAADMAKRYSAVYLERFDLRRVSSVPAPEVDDIPITGKYRVIAAPGVLRNVIESTCRRSGVAVKRIRARNTTATCHACGRVEEWRAAAKLVHKCGCGAVWDQDYNAAVLILRAGEAQGSASLRPSEEEVADVFQ